jgi:hypothetical protein
VALDWTVDLFFAKVSYSAKLSARRQFLTTKKKSDTELKLQLDESEHVMIRFGPDVCSNLDASLRREWLETNGIGGFASSTINGVNARRYHGLLVAATKPPVGRAVCPAIQGRRNTSRWRSVF